MTLLVLAGAVGCYDEDQFAEDYLDEYCNLTTACEAEVLAYYTDMGLDEATAQTSYDTMKDAICNPPDVEDTGATTEEDDCTFNADNAKSCIDELAATECQAWVDSTFAVPAICGDVCE